MNRLVMPKHRFLILSALLALLSLSACDTGPAEQPPLAGAAIGGAFDLVNTQGDEVRWSDFAGKYRMVYFGYAYCPDVCPFDVQRMMRGYEQFAEAKPELAKEVVPIFITIDPARDTPKVLAEFIANFTGPLIGLTGSLAQIDQAAKAFAVYYAKGDESSEGGYLMDHSRAAYLMGRDGEPIALLPVEAADKGESVAAELEKWVN